MYPLIYDISKRVDRVNLEIQKELQQLLADEVNK